MNAVIRRLPGQQDRNNLRVFKPSAVRLTEAVKLHFAVCVDDTGITLSIAFP